MNIAVFSAKRYDRDFLDKANASAGHKITYFDVPLEPETAALAADYDAVCIFVNDRADAGVLEALSRAERMNPPERPTQQFAGTRGIEFRGATRAQWKRRHPKPGDVRQCRAAKFQRRDDRDLGGGQLRGEGMLLQDLCIAPAPRAVKLQYQWFGIVPTQPVDTVFVAVERKQPAVRVETHLFSGFKHCVGAQI